MPWPTGPVDTRVKLDDLATPDDNRDLNATILRHGLCPKLSGSAGDYLSGAGTWLPFGTGHLTEVIDSLFFIRDDTTPAKRARFECSALSAGTSIFTFPTISAATLAVLQLAQTFTKAQTIDPDSDVVPLTLIGEAGQTADLLQVKDSSGNVLVSVDAAAAAGPGGIRHQVLSETTQLGTVTVPFYAVDTKDTQTYGILASNLFVGGSITRIRPWQTRRRNAADDTYMDWFMECKDGDTPALEIWRADRPDAGGTTFRKPMTFKYDGTVVLHGPTYGTQILNLLCTSLTAERTWTFGDYSGIPAVPTDEGTTGQILRATTSAQPVWAAASALATRQQWEWTANGRFIVDTSVDGGIVVPTAMTISAVWLYRTTAGSSGSTIVDIHKNGTTLYTTQANRPTIAFNDADSKVQATLPDVVAVAAGDVLTMDIDQIEGGSPGDLRLVIEGA